MAAWGWAAPAPCQLLLLFLCQLSSWHQCGEGHCCHSVPAAQAPVFAVSGLCLCLLHCLPLGTDMRLTGHPLGQWHLCALRSGHSQGQCQFWVCQSQTVPTGVNRNICITAHLTVHKVILGIPYARLLCPCAHTLPQLSPMQRVQPGFPQQQRLSSLPINKSILYSERVWICNWSRLNTFHSNKSSRGY